MSSGARALRTLPGRKPCLLPERRAALPAPFLHLACRPTPGPGAELLSSAQTSQLLVQRQQLGAWTASDLIYLPGLGPACSLGQIRARRSFLTSSPARLGWGSGWCAVRRVVPGGRGCAG